MARAMSHEPTHCPVMWFSLIEREAREEEEEEEEERAGGCWAGKVLS